MLQRRPAGRVGRRHGVLLRQPAPATDRARAAAAPGDGRRQPWFACACCPPNVMRLAELVAAVPRDRRRRAASRSTSTPIGIDRGRRRRRSCPPRRSRPAYPWSGAIAVTRRWRRRTQPWTLSLRVPGWCRSASAARSGRRDRPVADRRRGRSRARDASVAGRGPRSSSTWTCPSGSPQPDPADRRRAWLRRARARSPRLLHRDGRPAGRRARSRTIERRSDRSSRGRAADRPPGRRRSGCAVRGHRTPRPVAELDLGGHPVLRLGPPRPSPAMRVWIPVRRSGPTPA